MLPDPAVEDQRQAGLHAGRTVGNLAEVVPALRFGKLQAVRLLVEAEGAMVGRDHLEIIGPEAAPQRLLVGWGPERRGHDVLGPLEAGAIVVGDRQEQIMGARLSVHGEALVARLHHGRQRLGGREMHDVEGRSRQLGQPDRPVGGLPFHGGGSRQRMIPRRRVALGHRVLHQHLDDGAVLRVDADHGAAGGSHPHSSEQRAVVHHQHSRIGGEQLEAGHAFLDEGGHVGQRLSIDVEDDHVGADVDTGALRPPTPVLQARPQPLPASLVGEVDHGRGAAEGRCLRPRAEGVDRAGGAEIPIEMGMHVDPPGEDEQALRVVDLRMIGRREISPDHTYAVVFDEDVGGVLIDCGDNPSVLDQRRYHLSLLT